MEEVVGWDALAVDKYLVCDVEGAKVDGLWGLRRGLLARGGRAAHSHDWGAWALGEDCG